MKMMHRPALKKDLAALRKIFKPWNAQDPGVGKVLERAVESGSSQGERCDVFETDRVIRCASLWIPEGAKEIRLRALGIAPQAEDVGADRRFLCEEILQWAEMRVAKVNVTLPTTLAASLAGCLKKCGFMFEGISACYGSDEKPLVRMCKHFLYRTVAGSELMSFLSELLLFLGYEVRSEGDGFGFRIRSEYRLPFIFSPWHRVTRSGPDIVVHPPARILEPHELETLLFPLTVLGTSERPLLLPMEKKVAQHVIELPSTDTRQNSLFPPNALPVQREVRANNLAVCHPSGLRGIRRGLPLVFYVNRIGAVGTGRVDDWHLDEPKNLYNCLDDMCFFDPEDVREHAASSGPNAGKVLAIRFLWYRPFRRTVPLDEIRGMDGNFNPQRTRSLSKILFQSILSGGNAPGS